MEINKHFCSYEQSLALKELGFDEECFYVRLKDNPEHLYTPSDYNDFPEQKELEIYIPLKSQAFEFFRQFKNEINYVVSIKIPYLIDAGFIQDFEAEIYRFQKEDIYVGQGEDEEIFPKNSEVINSERFETYEEAESACIDKLISICNENKT